MFEVETEYYTAHLAEWLKLVSGKYVVIKGNKHIGFFDTDEAALQAAVRYFGLPPFLIKQVLEEEAHPEIPVLQLGILHASL